MALKGQLWRNMLSNSSNTSDTHAAQLEPLLSGAPHQAQAEAAQPVEPWGWHAGDGTPAHPAERVAQWPAHNRVRMRFPLYAAPPPAEAAPKQECCGNPLRGCADCPPRKLTFEEWLRQSSFVEPDAGTYLWMKDCWKAAQENK